MKYVGFVTEHDKIEEAKPFNSSINGSRNKDFSVVEMLDYLNKGVYFFGWMGYFRDFETQESIAPNCYYTDGVWIWPNYFPYYLKKHPNFFVNQEFADYVKMKFKETAKISVSTTDLKRIETEFLVKKKLI